MQGCDADGNYTSLLWQAVGCPLSKSNGCSEVGSLVLVLSSPYVDLCFALVCLCGTRCRCAECLSQVYGIPVLPLVVQGTWQYGGTVILFSLFLGLSTEAILRCMYVTVRADLPRVDIYNVQKCQ